MAKTYWQAMIEGQVRYLDVRGVRTRVLEAGDPDAEQTIFLLHGSGGHAENFVTNVVPLSAHGHVIAPDMLGHGLSERPVDITYSFQTMIDQMVALVKDVGSERVAVAGLSLGGLVAAHVAKALPDQVQRLSFICSGGLTPNSPADNTLPRLSDGVSALFADPTADAVRSRFQRMIHGPENLTEEMVELREYMLRLPGAPDTVIPILRDYDDHRDLYDASADVLGAIQASTLFCWGAHNHPGPELADQAAALMRDARVERFAESGHWPHVEEEAKFHEVMSAFLAQ